MKCKMSIKKVCSILLATSVLVTSVNISTYAAGKKAPKLNVGKKITMTTNETKSLKVKKSGDFFYYIYYYLKFKQQKK